MIDTPNRYRLVAVALLLVTLSGCRQLNTPWGLRLPWSKSARLSAAPSPPPTEAPEPLRPEQTAELQVVMARSLEHQGRTDDAKKMYLEAIKSAPKQADAYHRLALLHDRKGECRAAEKYYQDALERDGENAELQCDLGYSYYLQQRWPEAEAQLCRALTLAPDLGRAHNNLGLLLARTGRDREALIEFRRAGAGPAEAHANLAYVLALTDRPDEARAEFRRALEADPNLKAARQGLTSLDSLAAGRAGPAGPSPQGEAAVAAYIEPVTRPSEPAAKMR